jgi:hypothetical protein
MHATAVVRALQLEDAMTARVRLIGEAEVAVLNVLRSNAWRWLRFEEIQRGVQSYRRHTPPRTTRHHLGRFVAEGLIEFTDLIEPYPPDTWYRWNVDAPLSAVETLVAACRVEELLLEAVAPPPACCECGHDLARHGRVDPDGSRLCLRCYGVLDPKTAS